MRTALWQVESEFARDLLEAVKDFNKPEISAAENKLYVGPQLTDVAVETAYLTMRLRLARCCTGAVYAALVPHPEAGRTPRANLCCGGCLRASGDLLRSLQFVGVCRRTPHFGN
jgi:hypothetical protein